MESNVLKSLETCFDSMKRLDFLKVNFNKPQQKEYCVEEIKTEYKAKVLDMLNHLGDRKESIQYISMKELQIHMQKLEHTILKRISEFTQKQIEVFRLNQIINDEISSPQEAVGTSSQSNNQSNPNSNQIQEMESNFGSMNSNELKKDNNVTTNSEPSNLNKLPKFATKILNQWLRDHIDDPYPTIDEKMLLSAKTKLSIRQVGLFWAVDYQLVRKPQRTEDEDFEEQSKVLQPNQKQATDGISEIIFFWTKSHLWDLE